MMIQSVTFGDKNTWDDWKILPTERPVFLPPKLKTTYIDIPGGNGTLDLSESLTGYPVYENRTGSFSFIVMNDYKPWNERYTEIMEYLHGKAMNAILADDPNWFYNGRFSVDNWESRNTWSLITIGYNVNPYKWSVSTSAEPWLWNPFSFREGVIRDKFFREIEIDSPDNWVTYTFEKGLFGTAPISPTFNVTTESGLDGINVRFINSYLNIDKELYLRNGNTDVYDFIFYGADSYTIMFKGIGTVSIDFRVGRL